MTNEFIQIESHQSSGEKAWLKWVNEAEKKIGNSLDGDGQINGYSLDEAYDSWKVGMSTGDFITIVQYRQNYKVA